MEGRNRDQKYDIVYVSVGGSLVLAYKPSGSCYASDGDEIELVNHARGTVTGVDTYNRFEDLVEKEKKTGMEFVKIAAVLSRHEIEWEEE